MIALLALVALVSTSTTIACQDDITEKLRASDGQLIEIGPGECTCDPVVLAKRPGTEIRGSGEWFTRIWMQTGGIEAVAPLKIRDLTIWRADWKIVAPVFGVLSRARTSLEHVTIEGFTNNWRIDAPGIGNANTCEAFDFTSKGSGHAGLYVANNGDSNAGLFALVRVLTAGEHASKFPDLGPCAGIVDRSFLGNTWIATQVATTGEYIEGKRVAYPAYIFRGDDQHSITIGAYSEKGQLASEISFGSIVAGGAGGTWSGDGLRISGAYLSSLVLINDKDPANVTTLRAGKLAAKGTYFEAQTKRNGVAGPWVRVESDPKLARLIIQIANQLGVGFLDEKTGEMGKGK